MLVIEKYGTLHDFVCHPHAGAMLICSVFRQDERNQMVWFDEEILRVGGVNETGLVSLKVNYDGWL